MTKTVLVTGGAGFIGSHLCERLIEHGHSVICLDNLFTGSKSNLGVLLRHPRFELVRHDVCDPTIIEVDEIYHLACPASPVQYQRNPVRTIRTCVQGTLNMLELAREVSAKILLASTSEVYGDPTEHPQTEAYWGRVNPIGPRACYDEGKRCAEALTVSYANQFQVAVRIARIFNTYGPRMHENDGRVVSNFIVQCLRNEPISVYGSGEQTRSFCYVDDTVTALTALMASSTQDPVNIGNPTETSIWELAELIRHLTDSTVPIDRKPLPVDDPSRRCPDIHRAIEILGWQPQTPLLDGLRKTIADLRTRISNSLRLS